MLGGRRATREVTGALALVGATALWYLIGLPHGFTGQLVVDTLFTVLSAGAALLCLWTWRRLGSCGRPWLFIGLGCLSWFCGMLVWDAYELVLQVPVPYPSVADLGYLGFYPGFYTGLFLMLRQGSERIPTSALVLDASIVAVAASTLFFELVLHPFLQRLAVNELDLLVSMAWGAGTFGSLFLSTLALAWRIENLESRTLIVLLVGSLAFTIANAVYGRLALEHAYFSGHPADLAWLAGFVLVIAGERLELGRFTARRGFSRQLFRLAVTGILFGAASWPLWPTGAARIFGLGLLAIAGWLSATTSRGAGCASMGCTGTARSAC